MTHLIIILSVLLVAAVIVIVVLIVTRKRAARRAGESAEQRLRREIRNSQNELERITILYNNLNCLYHSRLHRARRSWFVYESARHHLSQRP